MRVKKSFPSAEIVSIDHDRLMAALKKIAAAIVKANPAVQDIRLFGSLTRNDWTPDSDIDLVIIVKTSDISFLKRRDAFADSFLDLPMDVDIKVYTLGEIEGMRTDGNEFIESVMEESVSLLETPF